MKETTLQISEGYRGISQYELEQQIDSQKSLW